MTEESAPPAASVGKEAIKELNQNDVLLGRGPGLSGFTGNLYFRALVDEKAAEYKATTNRKAKRRIAKEVLDVVHSRGGRFLKQEGGTVDYNAEWYIAETKVAIEKCKQALRENREPTTANGKGSSSSGKSEQNDDSNKKPTDSVGSVEETPSSEAAKPTSVSPSASPIPVQEAAPSASDVQRTASSDDTAKAAEAPQEEHGASTSPLVPTSSLSSASLPPVLHGNGIPSAVDPRLLLFGSPLLLQQQPLIPQPMETNPLFASPYLSTASLSPDLQGDMMNSNIAAAAVAHQLYLADNAMYSMLRDFALLQTQCASTAQDHTGKRTLDEEKLSESLDQEENGVKTTGLNATKENKAPASEEEEASSRETEQEEVAAFLLSSLAVVDRPVMTEEEEAEELATLTDQERASILSDAFGEGTVSRHQSKKARTYLDENSIAFLVRQMVLEIENIPPNKKQALVEALSKGRAEEFSDKRLEKFLRCEGMNSKLAAERFVKYWEGRRQVFGPGKYLLKMTLSEALKDDLVALETCVYTLLPHPDASGRQILYMEPHRHSRQGYTSESMLRAIWYVSEVTAQEINDNSSGIVQVCWFKNSSLFDYDLTVFDRWAYFLSSCWPVKLISNHMCCPTAIVNRIVKPIVHTFVSKDWRARTLTHDVPVDDILDVLAKYGIHKNMLPSVMGGDLQSHQSEWIENRRAAELEAL